MCIVMYTISSAVNVGDAGYNEGLSGIQRVYRITLLRYPVQTYPCMFDASLIVVM